VIPKVSRGTDIGGLCYYLTDVDPERTKNVHQDPHLVAGSPEAMAWFGDRTLNAADGRELGKVLDAARRTYGTEVSGGTTWHCSLSLKAGEGPLGDERWEKIAREFVAGMGFDDPESPKAPCAWAAVQHGPSTSGNEHIHLAVSLVRSDGTKADVFRDYRRAQQLSREIEIRHDLVRLESRDRGRATRGVSRAELERQKDRRASEPERVKLARAVRAVAAVSGTEAEFVNGLRDDGLRPRPWFARGSGRSVVGGYSVAAPDSPIRLGGANLASDLSLPRLRNAHGWEQDAGSVAAWQSQRAPQRVPRRPAADPRVWEQRAHEVGQLREWLKTIPLTDQATWAAVAHDLAGVFAAGAAARSGEERLALQEASDTLAKSAQVRASMAVPRPPEMPPTLDTARLVASATRGGKGSVAEAAMWLQLRNTAKAIHDAHVAAKDAQRAQEIAATMKGRLAELTRPAQAAPGTPARTAVLERPRPVRERAPEARGMDR
jgi:hypothetical protein